jgi:dipeptidyl-peptidase-4
MLSNERLFTTLDYQTEAPPIRVWSSQSAAYYTVLPSEKLPSEKASAPANSKPGAGKKGSKAEDNGGDIVRFDMKSGAHEIVISASSLIIPGGDVPLSIDGLAFSADETRVLIYTNSQRVWRKKTRGDYWVFDRKAKVLIKIGGEAPPATLMFAKFSPDGMAVAYVMANNIYCQRLSDHRITTLTHDGGVSCVNGTGDWVNEEELAIRDGFSWSPDGKSIAYWQFNTTDVPLFHLIDNTAELYPKIISFPYPKVGQTNSATRIGVVEVASSGAGDSGDSGEKGQKVPKVRWMKLPGDPRQHYVHSFSWTLDSSALAVQQLNRLQNTNRVFLADARSGEAQEVMTERDARGSLARGRGRVLG